MNKILPVFLIWVSIGSLFAQPKTVEVLGYEANQNAPLPFAKKNKDGQTIYDSRVFGSPKFFPGMIITASGEEIEGDIAVFNNTSDWDFVKRAIVIIPNGEDKGQYLGSGSVILINQKKKKEEVFYDYYDGIYLQRLVSGRLRLSYNPAAGNSKKISSFIGKSFLDSLTSNVVKKSIKQDLSNGKSLQESLEKAKLKSDLINVASDIEIVEKEYLLYDSVTEKLVAITEDNYAQVMTEYVKGCTSFNEKKLKDYKKINEVIQQINNECL
ncbi:hypothetical protein [Reichenbachiella sp. MALMAid0571]|uniref:hypothetical protein n=1 Tax=Reichenbachiella sp. MALMAid0571 TaxID=3143939 RepID=UPI0032DFAF9E